MTRGRDEDHAAHLAPARSRRIRRASSATTSTRCVPSTTLLEALDVLNEGLVARGRAARWRSTATAARASAGVWLVVDGRPHGPLPGTTTCMLPLRAFGDGGTITLEPFRDAGPSRSCATGGRSQRARPHRAGGGLRVGAHWQRARGQHDPGRARRRRRARWTRPRASAAAPASPPAPTAPQRCSSGRSSRTSVCLPQGQPERARRARALVAAADREGFGGCTLHGECQAVCPKRIDLGVIARMNREYLSAALATWWRGS